VEGDVIDHLVYATVNLADSVDALNSRLGVSLAPGGQHVGFGTRNFLADLGDSRYLEVIGPDPEQPAPDRPRLFGIDDLAEPRLVTWAARVSDLDEAVRRARAAGYDPGPIIAMSRESADDAPLRWRLTLPPASGELGGLVPFLIDWADMPHPSQAGGPRHAALVAHRVPS
jgi:hypothetical protein